MEDLIVFDNKYTTCKVEIDTILLAVGGMLPILRSLCIAYYY